MASLPSATRSATTCTAAKSMSVDISSQERAAIADPARIRELKLANLFEVFNEHDPTRRRGVIARNYTEDVIWSDRDGTTEGHEAMDEQAQKLVDRMPDFVFSAAGPVHVSRDLGLLSFNLGGAEAAAGGQRRRRGPGARWTDRRVVHALDRSELTTVRA
jgi:SnoaL-like domain